MLTGKSNSTATALSVMAMALLLLVAIHCATSSPAAGYWRHQQRPFNGDSGRLHLKPFDRHPIYSRQQPKTIETRSADIGEVQQEAGRSNPRQEDEIEWSRHVVLDKSAGTSRVHLFWNFDADNQLLTFELQAETKGWAGVGFSPSGGMTGADIVVCWVKDDGVPVFQDRHAPANGLPPLDSSQDYTLLSASENETHTICRFSRSIDTCDFTEDFLIVSDTVRVIYAFGETDPEAEDPYYHTTNRGTTSVYLLDPPTGVVTPDPETTKAHDVLTPNATVYGDKPTTYICSLHRAPDVTSPHHYIGYAPAIVPGNERHVHHALLYECYPKSQEEIDALEATLGMGAECYGSHMPVAWDECTGNTVFVAWAIGSEGQMYPENVGYHVAPIGGPGPRYYMMEMHYDNPTLETFVDNSGIRLYYTDKLRELEMGVLEVGIMVTPPWQIIPPKQKNFTSSAVCPSGCTEAGLPEDGINVFAGFLHSHLLGRSMKLRLVRDGVEQPWLQHDEHYDFDFQETRVFPEMKKLYRNDALILECTLDSSKRKSATLGGFGTEDEMCLAFLFYYPRSTLARCMNRHDSQQMVDLLGFPNMIPDLDNLQWMVDENRTFTEFLDEKYAPWDDPDTLAMFNGIATTKGHPSVARCYDDNHNLVTENAPVTYPEMVEYQPPPRECPVHAAVHQDNHVKTRKRDF